ncbi:MAG: hypothetical protein JWN04_1368 [Myxococcaceae bacterium]|nr:hypothetical protein [Myxococcaceae bacterium]
MITRYLFVAALVGCATHPTVPAAPLPKNVVVRVRDEPQPSTTRPVWSSSTLRISGGNFAAALEAPFEDAVPVVDDAKKAGLVTNCREYFRLSQLGFGTVSEENHNILRTEGVRCLAITRTGAMEPGAGTPETAFLKDATLTQKVPPTLGPSISDDELATRETSAQKGFSWSQYTAPLTFEVKDGSVIVKEVDTTSELTPIAAGDLNGDGVQELLVQAVCSGRQGDWVDLRLLVLSPETRNGETFYRLLESVRP